MGDNREIKRNLMKLRKNHLIELIDYVREHESEFDTSSKIAEYLMKNGIQSHFVKEGDSVWGVKELSKCSIDEADDCPDDVESCLDCPNYQKSFVLAEGFYNSTIHDYMYNKTVFKTKEEAENKLNELMKEVKAI